MYTIFDYLEYYKDTNLNEININEIDNLLFSILVYLPVSSFDKKMNFSEFANYALKYKNVKTSSSMARVAFEIISLLKNSKRFKDFYVSNFVNIKNEEMQFGGAKFSNKDTTIISFKGTDGSCIGWYENLRLSYMYPTKTQSYALDYIKNTIDNKDKNIYICGHSKGGNLALVSLIEASKSLFNRINKVYNFDGPGVLNDVFYSDKYKNAKTKLINIVPTGSVVGMLLYNDLYDVCESTEYAFNEHYPNSFKVFGTKFVKGNLSLVSKKIHQSTTEELSSLDKESVKDAVESLIKTLGKDGVEDFNFSLTDITEIVKNMKNIPASTRSYLVKMLTTLISVIGKNK